jgi:hypothetical protein
VDALVFYGLQKHAHTRERRSTKASVDIVKGLVCPIPRFSSRYHGGRRSTRYVRIGSALGIRYTCRTSARQVLLGLVSVRQVLQSAPGLQHLQLLQPKLAASFHLPPSIRRGLVRAIACCRSAYEANRYHAKC